MTKTPACCARYHRKPGFFPSSLPYLCFCVPNWVCKRPKIFSHAEDTKKSAGGLQSAISPQMGIGQSLGGRPRIEALEVQNINALRISYFTLTLFRIWGKKAPLAVFPLQLLQRYQLGPKTFWLLILTLFPHWCKISSSYLLPVPNYWTWPKTTHQKKRFSWSNPYKIEVLITSLTEMIELPNFGHMTTFTL